MPETPPICFAHKAYRLGDEFARRRPEEPYLEVRTFEALRAALPEVEVLVVSGLWHDDLIEASPKLRFIQSISAGMNQFSQPRLAAAGITLASAQGANERAVAEHTIGLLLSLTRHLARARDDQARRHWPPVVGDPADRQEELAGKTLLIVGFGRIGIRIARLARAFGMRVIGMKRSSSDAGEADEIVPPDRLLEVLPRADVLVLACPLTPETERLIRAEHLAAMKPSAYLVNVARGRVVDEEALIAALKEGSIRGAGLDCMVEEPLPATSELWGMANVVLTPHSAGETRGYEENVLDIFLDNLERFRAGRPPVNQSV